MAITQPQTPNQGPQASDRRNGLEKRDQPAPTGKTDPMQQIGQWVDDNPWATVGAAAGLGLALGLGSRRLGGGFGAVLTSTASGAAVRMAMNALVDLVEQRTGARR